MTIYRPKEMLDLDFFETELINACKLPSVKALHRLCCEAWTSDDHIEGVGYSSPSDGWTLTMSDYWVMQIAERMEAAAKCGDELADQLIVLELAAFALDELGKTEKAEDLFQIVEDMQEPFQPHGVEALLPRHSCHFFGVWQLLLARTVWPDDDWELYESDLHTFVGNSNGVVFDCLLYRDGLSKHHKGATRVDLQLTSAA